MPNKSVMPDQLRAAFASHGGVDMTCHACTVGLRMKLFCTFLITVVTVSCSSTPRPQSPVALSDAILTLPSKSLAGISKNGRVNYLEDKSGDYDENTRRLHLYGDDWKGRWNVHSQVYLRLFEDEQGRTIAASHLAGPLYADRELSDTNTNIFRWEDNRWIDITESVLPEATLRSWWFRFDKDGESIACGPYVEYLNVDSKIAHSHGDPSGELYWKDGRFYFSSNG